MRRTMSIAARLLALAGLLTLAACAANGSTNKPTTVSGRRNGIALHVGDQKAGSRALLAAAGLLDGTPYRIDWSEFTAGPPLLEALNAGSIDVGGVGDTPPIFAAAAGSRLALVAATRSDPQGSAILVPKHSTITDLAGLRGKKVALTKGSSANAHVLNALAKAGLRFTDITPAYLAPSDALAAFTAGSIDAWAIWDPYTALAQEKTGARVLADGRGLQSGLGFQVAALATLADQGKEAALRDYLGRLAKAREWVRGHPEQWALAWAREAGIAESVARTAVQRADQHAVPIDDELIATEQATADAFTVAGLIPKKVDIKAVVDRRFNDTASAA